jgi:hypothetical protein
MKMRIPTLNASRIDVPAEQKNVTEVQLAGNFSVPILRRLIGSKVVLFGMFFGAHTRYHIRPVLFDVASLRKRDDL